MQVRIRNSIAIVFGSLAATISAQAQLIVTGQNCDCSIPSSAYEIIPLANGHFDVNLLRIHRTYPPRPPAMGQALAEPLPARATRAAGGV